MTSRSYSWHCESAYELYQFLQNLLKVYVKYTRGNLPQLTGIEYQESRMLPRASPNPNEYRFMILSYRITEFPLTLQQNCPTSNPAVATAPNRTRPQRLGFKPGIRSGLWVRIHRTKLAHRQRLCRSDCPNAIQPSGPKNVSSRITTVPFPQTGRSTAELLLPEAGSRPEFAFGKTRGSCAGGLAHSSTHDRPRISTVASSSPIQDFNRERPLRPFSSTKRR